MLLAVVVTGFILIITGTQIHPEGGRRPLDVGAYLIMASAGVSLVMRRIRPLITLVVTTIVLMAYLARDYPGGPIFMTLFIALFSLATQWERGRAYGAAAVASAALVVVTLVTGTGPGVVHLVFISWAAASVFLGDTLRTRRRYLVGVQERNRVLERSQLDEARRQVSEERLRIARDLHDSVAHAMTIINVQAAAAGRFVHRDAAQAAESIEIVRRTSQEVLAEMRVFLGVLRRDDQSPERAPTADLEGLADLVESARSAARPVRLDFEGSLDAVTGPVSVAAYRIIQESLTNVARHAGTGATATVTLLAGDHGEVYLEVVDDGMGPTGHGDPAGVGLVGMRERAVATGGVFAAGPAPGGGFRVTATWSGTADPGAAP